MRHVLVKDYDSNIAGCMRTMVCSCGWRIEHNFSEARRRFDRHVERHVERDNPLLRAYLYLKRYATGPVRLDRRA